jgi:hypothetical protein
LQAHNVTANCQVSAQHTHYIQFVACYQLWDRVVQQVHVLELQGPKGATLQLRWHRGVCRALGRPWLYCRAAAQGCPFQRRVRVPGTLILLCARLVQYELLPAIRVRAPARELLMRTDQAGSFPMNFSQRTATIAPRACGSSPHDSGNRNPQNLAHLSALRCNLNSPSLRLKSVARVVATGATNRGRCEES